MMSRLGPTNHVPASFFLQPLIRSYAEVASDGNLWRVEVRGDAHHKVQVKLPMPHRVAGPATNDNTSTHHPR